MRFLLIFLIFSALHAAEPEDISQKNKPLTIKILLQTPTNKPYVEVKGGYLLYHPLTGKHITSHTRRRRGKIQTKENGLHWGKKIKDHFEVRIVPSSEKSKIFVNGIQYKGCLEIYSIGGKISLVNEVNSENYLKSILCTKIQKKHSPKVLEALAIVERTNLYHFINKCGYASWHVKSDEVSYTGLKNIKKRRAVAAAVARTEDIVLTYQKQPFAALYAPNHAGKSASYSALFRKVWKTPPGVSKLPSSTLRDKSRWSFSIKKENLGHLFGLKNINQVALFVVKGSTKAYGVRLANKNSHLDMDFDRFQKAFGPELLKSNDFTMRIVNDKVYFSGYGRGLGSGLCLASAEIQARRNMSARKILNYHFPKTELINLREELGDAFERNYIWR